MSNNTGLNPLPLFNNNKSLYGTRAQINQSSKKISIIEDKTTLEPVRPTPSSPVTSSINSHSNYPRSTSVNIPASSDPSRSQIHKQIQIQKQALNSIELNQMHENVFKQLDDWKNSMYNRILSIKDRTLEENSQSYNQLATLQDLMKKLLEESIIKQLLNMKTNPQSASSEELNRIEQQLAQVKEQIELLKQKDLQLDSSNVDVIGDLQLNKTTDFSKHQPLARPSPSPPPPQAFRSQSHSLSSTPNKDSNLSTSAPIFESIENKPTAPVWTEATRQGLNSLAHYLPFRLLIPNYVREQLIDNFDIEQFDTDLKLSCQSPIESILTILNQNDLEASIDILTDVMMAFKCTPTQYELRLLYQKKFIPILTGKRTERLDRLRDKYQLDMVKVFLQTCPQSDERIVLLRGQNPEYMIFCLREIIQNVLEQAHFTDEDKSLTYEMYDPSVNYDESSAHEYGGYKSNDICEIVLNNNTNNNNNNINSTEDLSESKQRSIISSSSSLSKNRYNSDDTPLNYDDTEPESDDDDDDDEDGFKRSKSSDDKRIFIKELNYVKGRQVGLLIGPFGQHITQIREQTGAKIHLTNDDNEPSVIKGTKSQINQALRLINECLQTQKPIPKTTYKGGRRR